MVIQIVITNIKNDYNKDCLKYCIEYTEMIKITIDKTNFILLPAKVVLIPTFAKLASTLCENKEVVLTADNGAKHIVASRDIDEFSFLRHDVSPKVLSAFGAIILSDFSVVD